ncbi:hypothetical protein FACHB389_19510 [Nostoc calcicola FACHB-389]|nr:LysM peptidoglycan-binding domain-containing protein [Nostoc calcicola FACHB-3891]OKH32603.1 hypothetical protein FACHB389_19510 [Nostoc calcicola FACHB-389]
MPQTTYTVVDGDTLSKIAEKFFGAGCPDWMWKSIYDTNRDKIGDDPNKLEVGMVLIVPILNAT